MPIYEYRCTSCEGEFEELVFGDKTPDCPHCGAKHPEKLLSAHTVGASGGSRERAPAMGPCGSCGDPRGPGSCGID